MAQAIAALPRAAAIYCRISRDDEGEAMGVDRQEQDCRRLAKARRWKVAEHVYIDNDVSAYSGKPRRAYERMLSAVEEGALDAIVTW